MNDERWPGEDRLLSMDDEELGPEVPEDEVDLEPGEEELAEAEGEAAPEEEQLDETPPAEEDELPRLRGAEHAVGDLDVPDGYNVVTGSADGGKRSVGIVVSRFNGEITNRLLESALDELERAGVAREAVTIVPVPGAFELPIAAMALARSRRFACIVALGCVIRGETAHFEYVAGEAASGLQLAGLETGVPVSFGLLTLENAEQADSRADKGAEAVRSGLEMADLFTQIRAASANI